MALFNEDRTVYSKVFFSSIGNNHSYFMINLRDMERSGYWMISFPIPGERVEEEVNHEEAVEIFNKIKNWYDY